ncbi:MAG TPA: ABC transporter permease, partial [Segetibacter sp.]|nr:ABC transporter permease [Segetibacter sp.]
MINIASLAIGITGCLVIALFVWDELQYDKFFEGHENVYRVYNESEKENSKQNVAVTPPMFATYLQQQYPEVDTSLHILMSSSKFLFEAAEKVNYEDKGLFVEGSFFNVFPLKFVKGDPNTALAAPMSVVITDDLAKKYFGTSEAIDKTIYIDKDTFAVKGVLAELPKHFHLDFNYLMSLSSAKLPKARMEKWTWTQFYTYIKVKPGTDRQQLERKFEAAIEKDVKPMMKADRITFTPHLQELKNIHLRSSDFVYDNAIRGNETYVKGLTMIALFVLVIACFNFINLATARSFRRAKEIGVRKVVGAGRKQLIGQFTGETILLSVFSIIIATIATLILVPFLNDFTGKEI